jgi:inner membrane protease subunit 2
MAPSLSPLSHEQGGLGNERVIISKWFPARDVKRGDVVTFWKPHRRGEVSIKRVVGVGGDVVRVGRGRERGTGTGEKGYSAGGEEKDGMEGGGMGIGMEKRVGLFDGLGDANSSEQTSPGTVVVPHGHIWVEGDNWRKSYDSNDFGPISKALVDGRAVRVWRDGWWRQVGDLREDRDRRHAGRVLREGGSEVPGAFLE